MCSGRSIKVAKRKQQSYRYALWLLNFTFKQIGNIDACPVTKEAWEKRAAERDSECGGESVYHCLSDNEGRKWEKCVLQSLIKKGNLILHITILLSYLYE